MTGFLSWSGIGMPKEFADSLVGAHVCVHWRETGKDDDLPPLHGTGDCEMVVVPTPGWRDWLCGDEGFGIRLSSIVYVHLSNGACPSWSGRYGADQGADHQ